MRAEFTGPGGVLDIAATDEDEKITIRFSASRDSATIDFQPDLLGPFEFWRLDGGSISIGPPSERQYSPLCEFPIVGASKCQGESPCT